MTTVNAESDLELRFIARPLDRVLVEASLRCEAFSREFSRFAPRTELFLWLADEIYKRRLTRIHERDFSGK